MLSNDLKKGDKVVLANGWNATIEDNKRGNTRLATVKGFVTEMGSVYVWDIQGIKLTAKQTKARNAVKAMGF
tara:strand:+ start:1900 stop:2115 length:216 start_codon:yes stop_codon:yes gene_type:complete